MKRRNFIRNSGVILVGASTGGISQDATGSAIVYLHPEVSNLSDFPLAEGKRLPFGWSAFAVPVPGEDKGPLLKWTDLPSSGQARLRLTIAVDLREEIAIDVRLAESGEKISELDIRFAPVLEPFELILTEEQTQKVAAEGISLVMTKGKNPVWFFQVDQERMSHATLQPHLLFSENSGAALSEFYKRVASPVSLQPYGWMEGCVMDGLYDLFHAKGDARFEKALHSHVGYFFNEKNELIYEDPKSRPNDGVVSDIESTLPNAVIAKLNPDHPIFEKVIDFWMTHQDEAGCVRDGGTTSAEGSYTIAYPMMVMGTQQKDESLIALSLKQLRLRRERLIHNDDCWLRYHKGGNRSFQNWARGVAWYSLGLVRTLSEYKGDEDVSDLKSEVERFAKWVSGHQKENGLWNCFLHEDVPTDSSGSAGIAAALAIAVKNGLLSDEYLNVSQKTFEGLESYLTPDGLLTGVAQSNRGGEALQKSDYRVISQMGMGLMAQLAAALK